jgi:hypothetical protein
MRVASVLAVLLLASLVPHPASAQAPAGHLLTDPKGDVVFDPGAPGAPAVPLSAGDQSDSADLLALDLVESADAFDLAVQVATIKGNAGFDLTIHWTWRDYEYVVEASRSNPAFGTFQFASLTRLGAEGRERVAALDMTIDAEKGVATITVPKVYVLDGQNRAPGQGDAITAISVVAEETTFSFSIEGSHPASLRDAMPNEGDGASFAFAVGDFAQGHIKLTAPERMRVSNGGATTFVFQTILANNGSSEEEVALSIQNLPEGWNGTVQSPVRVPAHGEKTIAVLASVPFEHKHGGFDSFNVTAQSNRDPGSRAVVRLGVLHTPIPQPAGHHSELYLHARAQNGGPFATVFPFNEGFMNTEAAHDNDADAMTPNQFSGSGWSIPLNPGLQMGIDFDVEKTGTLTGSIMGRGNGEASISAKLLLYHASADENGRDRGVLLAAAKAATIALDLQKPTTFALTLTPTPDADYVPYAKDQNLVLQITLKSDTPDLCCFGGNTGPALSTKDFKMALPLNEYHDQLSGVADVASALDLVAEGPVEKLGRPGAIMTYAFTLKNGAAHETRVDLDLAGNDANLATLVPSGSVKLDAGETRKVTLAVHIPGDAPEGQEIEALVFAHARDDPSVMAIARTKTTVTLGSGAGDDETDILVQARDAQKDTPAPGLALLAGAAVVALALRRR